MSPRFLAQLLLQLLVWTGSCSWGLDYFSFYKDLKLADNDVAQTRNVSSSCACFTICRALPDCTAATFTSLTPDSTEHSCLISNKKMLKRNLEASSGGVHTSLIVGYQLHIIFDIATYDDAKKACKGLGMRLASFSDMKSFSSVNAYLAQFFLTGFLWIDLRKINGVWTWRDGVVNDYDIGEGPWEENHPRSSHEAAAIRLLKDNISLNSVDFYKVSPLCET